MSTVRPLRIHGRHLPVFPSDGAMRTPSPPSEEIDFTRIFTSIRRHPLSFVLPALLAVVLAFVYVSAIPPKFTAGTELIVDARRTGFVRAAEVNSSFANAPPDPSLAMTEMDFIKSRLIAGKVVDRLHLAEDPEFNGAAARRSSLISYIRTGVAEAANLLDEATGTTHASQWLGQFRALRADDADDARGVRDVTIDNVQEALTVRNDGKSYTIEIKFVALEPDKAATIANSFADVYVTEQLESKSRAVVQAGQWLEKRVAELRDQISLGETAIQEFREQNNVAVASRERDSIIGRQLSELESQLINVMAERDVADARLQSAEKKLGDGDKGAANLDRDVLMSPALASLIQQETLLRRKDAELASQYGASHPAVRNIRAELDSVHARLQIEQRRSVLALRNEADLARARQRSYDVAYRKANDKAAEYTRVEAKLRQMEVDLQANRDMYMGLLTRSKEVDAQRSAQTADAMIVSPAVPPEFPSSPKKLLVLGIGGLLGTVAGAFAASRRDRSDRGYHVASSVEQETGYPVLCSVPLVRQVKQAAPVEHVVAQPRSSYSEAMLTARTNMQALNKRVHPKVIVVTSSLPNEGKTTFGLSMARSYAMSGKRVLALDCDLRRTGLTRMLTESRHGECLGDLLSSPDPIGHADVERVIRQDGASGMHFIPSRPVHRNNPQDLLASDQMQRLLAICAESYDCIIIDTPPVMIVSDAMAIMQSADASIFVIRWGKTPREVTEKALAQFSTLKLPVSGVVLTQVDVRRQKKYGFSDQASYAHEASNYYLT